MEKTETCKDPEIRAKRIVGMRKSKTFSDKDFCRKNGKLFHEDPEKVKLLEKGRIKFLASDAKKERDQKCRDFWKNNPEKLAERNAKIKANRASEEYKNKLPYICQKIFDTKIEKYGTSDYRKIANIRGTVSSENELRNWLKTLGFDFKEAKIEGDTRLLDGKCGNYAFEYCGLYWHNENSPSPRDRNYHFTKFSKCRDNGIRLFTIFSDEWETRQDQVKDFIASALGIFERKFFARKLVVKEIENSVAKKFYDDYHIQGRDSNSQISAGLFAAEELVGVMTFGKHHRKAEMDVFTLSRLCYKNGVSVVGGASKLFCFLVERTKTKKVISWSDNRWSRGNVYLKMGFTEECQLPPDYSYVKTTTTRYRMSKQSQAKKKSGCPNGKTELEWANERGLSRIWDCGKIRWVWNQ